MSRKRTVYTTEFKTKLVIELMNEDKTIAEIANKYKITPKNLQNWKKIFMENAEMAMEPAKAVKEYKEEIIELKEKNETYAKVVGKMTIEKEWLEKKLNSLSLSDKKTMIEPELKNLSVSNLSMANNFDPLADRIAEGLSPPASTTPCMRVRTGRFLK
jgi:transposase-like protein